MTEAPRPWWAFLLKRPMHFVLDAVVLLAVFALAYHLRFEFRVPAYWAHRAYAQAPVVVALELFALWLCGVYAFIWRYVGIHEVGAFFKAALLAAVPIIIVRYLHLGARDLVLVPWSVVVMNTAFAFGGTLGLRVVRRTLHERFEKKNAAAAKRKKRTILIGAGRAGALAAREIVGRADSDLDVVCFVDDDREKHGSSIQGVKVLGATADLSRLVKDQHIEQVVITIARASRPDFRRILEICERIPVKVRIIPGLFELLQGNVAVTRIRDVQVEDLLGREPVQLDHELIGRFLTGRVVLVSGAGGSIGSELARQVARVGPKELLLVERAEGPLFEIDRELKSAWPNVKITPLVADVGDETRIDELFARHKPEVVIHAAAHKHVPMMEQNPGEAIKNNVVGTRTLARTAGRHGAATFVMISTDKAVRPTSVMGASKRVAELVIQDLDRQFEGTTFVAVRFGNVLGSAGSVIPIFREQILKGGPVTVTHPDMVRYFMTIPEASQLVLQAGAMGAGGEIFVLDMGEPVKIVELAKDMIRLSGLKPFEDIEIEFTGMRPGEKLFEEIEAHGEAMQKTRHPKIFIGQLQPADSDLLEAAIKGLLVAADRGEPAEVRAALSELLPEATLGGQGKPTAPPMPAAAAHGSPVTA